MIAENGESEYRLHLKITQELRQNFIPHFHVPNGEYRNPITASKLKCMGVLSGVSDLILILMGRTVYVEIKGAHGIQHYNQVRFQNMVNDSKQAYLIWRSVKDAKEYIDSLRLGIDYVPFQFVELPGKKPV